MSGGDQQIGEGGEAEGMEGEREGEHEGNDGRFANPIAAPSADLVGIHSFTLFLLLFFFLLFYSLMNEKKLRRLTSMHSLMMMMKK